MDLIGPRKRRVPPRRAPAPDGPQPAPLPPVVGTSGPLGTITIPVGSRLLDALARHAAPIECLAWAPDGRHFASGGRDGRVVVWQLEQGAWAVAHDIDAHHLPTK